MKEGKTFHISQNEVLNAYKAVKANKGAGGVDGIELEEFDKTDCMCCGTGCHPAATSQNRSEELKYRKRMER